MLRDDDDLGWYARKADALRRPIALPASARDGDRERRVAALLRELERRGVRGSLRDRTLYTRGLPPGCRGCLSGKGTNLFVTGLCTRDCYFCFNAAPRKDELAVHGIGIAAQRPEDCADTVARYGLRSIGLSGGEPLLRPERVLRIVEALRRLPFRVRIDLYTNGDLADARTLRRLKRAGVDGLRFNLAANGYDTAPVERAKAIFSELAVEIPALPEELVEQRALVLELDRLGVGHLILHELFACRENQTRLGERKLGRAGGEAPELQWEPVDEGEAAALELLLFALRRAGSLSAYYCSCRTQALISARGLRRRERLT